MAKTFKTTVLSPTAEIFKGSVQYVSLPTHDGQAGIAQDHAATVFKLGIGRLTITDAKNQKHYFVLVNGLAEVRTNHLCILADQAFVCNEAGKEQVQELLKKSQQLPENNAAQEQVKKSDIERYQAVSASF